MRALRWPDAFPAGDVALHKALGVQGKAARRARPNALAGLAALAQLRRGARLGTRRTRRAVEPPHPHRSMPIMKFDPHHAYQTR